MNFFSFRSAKWTAPDLLGFLGAATIVFVAIYITSLTFVYVEGDDATSIVYHAMGRDRSVQPPYSAYHGMMDVFLGWLPADEVILRHVAISFTSAAAFLMVVLVLMLIREWHEPMSGWTSALLALLLLACSPEIFYLGLVYTPILTAMFFVLAAHLVIRKGVASLYGSKPSFGFFAATFALSAIVFGIGVACRWDAGTYLFFISADLLLILGAKIGAKRLLTIVIAWGAAAFSMSLLSIWLSGYGLAQVESTLALARTEVLHWDSWFALFGAYQTMFTPAFVLLLAIGWIVLAKNNWRLALLSALGLLPVIPFLFSREPKMILTALPGLWLAASTGIRFVFDDKYSGRRVRWAARAAIVVLTALPWLISLHVESAETSWGPGFEIKTPIQRESDVVSGEVISDQVSKRSVSVRRWNFGFTGGFAVPTPEGPRPLGGHLSVLLGGEWRRLHLAFDRERQGVVETVINDGHNLMQDEGNSLITAKLLELGYRTSDPKVDYASNLVTERRFIRNDGRVVNLQLLRKRGSLFEPEDLGRLAMLNPSGKVVLFSGYSSTIRRLAEDSPEATVLQGSFSAIVDLELLRRPVESEADEKVAN